MVFDRWNYNRILKWTQTLLLVHALSVCAWMEMSSLFVVVVSTLMLNQMFHKAYIRPLIYMQECWAALFFFFFRRDYIWNLLKCLCLQTEWAPSWIKISFSKIFMLFLPNAMYGIYILYIYKLYLAVFMQNNAFTYIYTQQHIRTKNSAVHCACSSFENPLSISSLG